MPATKPFTAPKVLANTTKPAVGVINASSVPFNAIDVTSKEQVWTEQHANTKILGENSKQQLPLSISFFPSCNPINMQIIVRHQTPYVNANPLFPLSADSSLKKVLIMYG